MIRKAKITETCPNQKSDPSWTYAEEGTHSSFHSPEISYFL